MASGRFDKAKWYAERVRERRQQLGLTQPELATRARTTPGFVDQLERGQARLSSRGAGRVFEVLELDRGVDATEPAGKG